MKTLNNPHWQVYEISQDGTHHLMGKKAAYEKRFFRVLKFHYPGIAPVLDETGAYHINPLGQPIYSQRYTRTFGFYCGLASVNNLGEWLHILPDGSPLYKTRYAWCGNFQENFCAVREPSGFLFHIDAKGARLYPQSYSYVGDFHDGIAVVQAENGLHFHINPSGKSIHPYGFIDLDIYHKGFARAKDPQGWFHIDRSGRPIYQEKYALIEPFYNGFARVETKWGEILLIDEEGEVIQKIRKALQDPFHEVSKDLISYWRLFTLKTAQDLHIFDILPSTLPIIANKTGLSFSMAEKILLGLKEMNYVLQSGEVWNVTNTGEFLISSHPFTLNEAQNLWMEEHFTSWHELLYSLKHQKSAFEKYYQDQWFEFLNKNPKKRNLYHQALSQYAKRDYIDFWEKIDFSSYQSIADIGGSIGTVLKILMSKYPHLIGHLIDLPAVLKQVSLPESLRKKISFHSCNFFETWPKLKVDAGVLCRVIHDWSDNDALHILKQAHTLLNNSASRLFVVENILDKDTGSGALLNLNMLVMTGGQERTLDEFYSLFEKAGFSIESRVLLNAVSSIFVLKPLK